MSYSHRPGTAATAHAIAPAPWTARRPTQAVPQPSLPVRQYEALGLLPDGGLAEISKRAPAHPIFESAFSAFARGTIMATEDGPVAVEDLLPGTRIETRDAGFQPLLWIGTMTLLPNHKVGQMPSRLFRIPVDSFGPQRPVPDLMLAPHARLLHRSAKLRSMARDDSALAPISAFEDGHTVIRVAPVSAVSVYHLAFRDHHILRANGLDVESYHPGEDLISRIGGDSLRMFQSFFPHIKAISEFGPLCAPRVTIEEFETLSAG